MQEEKQQKREHEKRRREIGTKAQGRKRRGSSDSEEVVPLSTSLAHSVARNIRFDVLLHEDRIERELKLEWRRIRKEGGSRTHQRMTDR